MITDGQVVEIAPRVATQDVYIGGSGIDTLQMTDASEAFILDSNSLVIPDNNYRARLEDVEIVKAGGGDDIVDLTSHQYTYGDVTLYGEEGNDILWASAGDDVLYGGAGLDQLSGGTGADTFVFEATAFDAVDEISDFNAAEGDALDISEILSGYDPLSDVLSDFIEITESNGNSYVSVAENGDQNFQTITELTNVTGLDDLDTLDSSGTLII